VQSRAKAEHQCLGLGASDTQTHFGYTVGGGVEWGFTPNWSVKGEYLWAHYESRNYFASLIPPGVASGTFDVNTVKLGVNYRFGWAARSRRATKRKARLRLSPLQ
jgi:outer membrane immunogenic protein